MRNPLSGTLEHRIFEGSDAKAFLDGSVLTIQVNCKADGGVLTDTIPFGIAVTLEVGSTVNIDVYEEIKVRLRPQVVVPVPV